MRKDMGTTKVNNSKAAIDKVFKMEGSKSGKMKELFDMGLDVKEITAEFLLHDTPVRYNFVYNVVSNHCNMNGIEVVKEERGGKKNTIVELHKQGKTNTEISKELRTNYNYVYKVVRDYKKEQESTKASTTTGTKASTKTSTKTGTKRGTKKVTKAGTTK